jgi:hypothetical protein
MTPYDQGYHDAVANAIACFGGTLAACGLALVLFGVSAWIHERNRD